MHVKVDLIFWAFLDEKGRRRQQIDIIDEQTWATKFTEALIKLMLCSVYLSESASTIKKKQNANQTNGT